MKIEKGFSQKKHEIWLEPLDFGFICPPAKAGGN